MSITKSAKGLIGTAGLSLLSLPYAGWIVLALIVVFISIFLGLFITIYMTLSSLHLFTAIIFTVVVVGMMILAARTGLLTKETMHENSWIWLLIPGAFVIGYVFEAVTPAGLTIAPMDTLGAGTSSVAVSTITTFLFVALALGLAGSLIGGRGHKRQIQGPRTRY